MQSHTFDNVNLYLEMWKWMEVSTKNEYANQLMQSCTYGHSSVAKQCKIILFRSSRRAENINIQWANSLWQGETGANVLVGIQVPPEYLDEFRSRADSLGYEYMSEMNNEIYNLLLRNPKVWDAADYHQSNQWLVSMSSTNWWGLTSEDLLKVGLLAWLALSVGIKTPSYLYLYVELLVWHSSTCYLV